MAEPESQGSFVARIWLEGKEGGQQTWRGHIQHVQGRQEAYFESLEDMGAFMERICGLTFPKRGRRERAQRRRERKGEED